MSNSQYPEDSRALCTGTVPPHRSLDTGVAGIHRAACDRAECAGASGHRAAGRTKSAAHRLDARVLEPIARPRPPALQARGARLDATLALARLVGAAPGALGLDGAAARDPQRQRGRPGPAGADPAGGRLTRPLDGAARSLWPRPAGAARHAGHRPGAGRAALAPTWASQRAPALGPVRTPPGAPGPQASAPTPGCRPPDRSLGGALHQPSDLVGGRAQL